MKLAPAKDPLSPMDRQMIEMHISQLQSLPNVAPGTAMFIIKNCAKDAPKLYAQVLRLARDLKEAEDHAEYWKGQAEGLKAAILSGTKIEFEQKTAAPVEPKGGA